MNDLELEMIRSTEVEDIVAAWTEWELAWAIKDLSTEPANKVAGCINLFVTFNVESNVMKTGLVNLEGVVGKTGFRLPDVKCRAVRAFDIDRQVVMRTTVVLDLTHRVAEERKKWPEESHRLGQVT
jgi:hypothetical protein